MGVWRKRERGDFSRREFLRPFAGHQRNRFVLSRCPSFIILNGDVDAVRESNEKLTRPAKSCKLLNQFWARKRENQSCSLWSKASATARTFTHKVEWESFTRVISGQQHASFRLNKVRVCLQWLENKSHRKALNSTFFSLFLHTSHSFAVQSWNSYIVDSHNVVKKRNIENSVAWWERASERECE